MSEKDSVDVKQFLQFIRLRDYDGIHSMLHNDFDCNEYSKEADCRLFHLIVGDEDKTFAENTTKLCLIYGADANLRDTEGLTPMHVCAHWGRTSVFKILLSCGGNPSLRDNCGLNCYEHALKHGHLEIIQMMLSVAEDTALDLLDTTGNEHFLVNEWMKKHVKNNTNENLMDLSYGADFNISNNNIDQFNKDFDGNKSKKYVHNDTPQVLDQITEVDSNDSVSTITESNCTTSNQNSDEFVSCESQIVKSEKPSFSSNECSNITLISKESDLKYISSDAYITEDYSIISGDSSPGVCSSIKRSVSEFKDHSISPICSNLQYDISGINPLESINLSNSLEDLEYNVPKESIFTEDLFKNVTIRKHTAAGNSLLDRDNKEETDFNAKFAFVKYYKPPLLTVKQEVNNIESYSKSLNATNSCTSICEELSLSELSTNKDYLKNNVTDDCGFSSSQSLHENTERVRSRKKWKKVNTASSKSLFSTFDLSSINENFNLSKENYKTEVQNFNTMDNDAILDTEYLNRNIEINNISERIQNHLSVCDSLADKYKNEQLANINLNKNQNKEYLEVPNSLNYVNENRWPNSYEKDRTNFETGIIEPTMHLTSNSFIGVAEEREIKLDEIDVVLVERRFLVTPCVSENDETNSTISTDYSLAKSEDYDTDRLKKDLNNFGVIPGPITKSTKRVYIKQLFKLQKHGKLYDANELEKVYSLYSCELSKALKNVNWVNDLSRYIALDNAVSKQFSNTENGKKWRGGCQKASFTYLLLDPRITNNMPALVASKNLDKIDIMKEAWPNFIHSIFYIGKGIRSRPYAHLYEAVQSWNAKEIRDKEKSNKEKIEKIRNIWESQHGVVCLNVFQHVIPAEAFTREAAMIDALTLKKLTNIKSGEYYGIAASWSCREKKNFGVYLLYKAMNIFLHEGERQIYPSDIR